MHTWKTCLTMLWVFKVLKININVLFYNELIDWQKTYTEAPILSNVSDQFLHSLVKSRRNDDSTTAILHTSFRARHWQSRPYSFVIKIQEKLWSKIKFVLENKWQSLKAWKIFFSNTYVNYILSYVMSCHELCLVLMLYRCCLSSNKWNFSSFSLHLSCPFCDELTFIRSTTTDFVGYSLGLILYHSFSKT